MKTVVSSSRHSRVAAVAIVLIAVALAIGAVACDDNYELTISSTTGGSVITPEEGTHTYEAGTVVELVATTDEGYVFTGWTGDTEHIANPKSASTTITMNGNYSIIARFKQEGAEPAPSAP